jgi:hypothetical protein
VLTRYLPYRSSYPYPIPSSPISVAQAVGFYGYYPGTHRNAGLLKQSSKPAALAGSPGLNAGSDTIYYDYNDLGQLTQQCVQRQL